MNLKRREALRLTAIIGLMAATGLISQAEAAEWNKAAFDAQSATVARLTREANNSRAALDRLREQFAKTDLGKAAIKSPTEIEAMIDRASIERSRCLEIAARDTVKEEDKVNDVCPQLVK